MKSKKDLLFGLVIFAASSLIVLLFLEFAIGSSGLVSDQFGQWDDLLWVTLEKNKAGSFYNDLGVEIPIKINSQGFRGDEFTQKNSSKFRILIFGDSFMASMGNTLNETVPKILEELLQKNYPNKEFEVFNLGVSGYSFTTYFLLLNKTIETLKPDFIIFNAYLGNDIQQDNLETDKESYPHFSIINSSLKLISPIKPNEYIWNEKFGWIFPKIQRFIFYRILYSKINVATLKEITPQDNINIYLVNSSAVFDTNWRIIKGILKKTDDLCKRKEVKFSVVSLTQPEQLYDDWRSNLINQYTNLSSTDLDFAKPDLTLLSICKDLNISCYSSLNFFSEVVSKVGLRTTFPKDPHYSYVGNKLHAEFLYQTFFQNSSLLID